MLLPGQVSHENVPLWLNSADLFVMPSLKESFGTAIVEAMSCGKPVVASAVGGIPEIITNDRVGTLVEPGNPEALRQGMVSAIDRRWEPDVIIGESRKYSWPNLAPKVASIYCELLGQEVKPSETPR